MDPSPSRSRDAGQPVPLETPGPQIVLPARSCICLDCRVALQHGERCDGGAGHHVVSLRTREGRLRLVEAVWGSVGLPAREVGGDEAGALQAPRRSGAEVLAGIVLAPAVVCAGAAIVARSLALVALALAAFGAGRLLLWRRWSLGKLVSEVYSQVPERKVHARGATAPWTAAPDAPETRASGIAHGEPLISSPFGGSECLAYAVVLKARSEAGTAVLLRDGVTAGFDVLLDEGERVRIPAGRIVIEGRPTWVFLARNQPHEAYLEGIDPLRKSEQYHFNDPFRCDVAEELVLEPGEPVEIVGPLTPGEDRSELPESPRAVRRRVLRPVGTPVLRFAGAARIAFPPDVA